MINSRLWLHTCTPEEAGGFVGQAAAERLRNHTRLVESLPNKRDSALVEVNKVACNTEAKISPRN